MKKNRLIILLPYIICVIFFILYSTLSIIRHNHFGSYGFDLGISDQIVWKYSQFKFPTTTVYYNPFVSIFIDHIEIIYLLLAPFYWIWSDAKMLLLLQAFFISFSALPIFLLCKTKKINTFLSISLMISYLCFYGIQNAIWFDVHSATFAASFLPWLIYFLDKKKKLSSLIFLILIIINKENMALLTFLISFTFLILERKKFYIFPLLISLAYFIFIFFIYFPHFVPGGYTYQNDKGLLSDVNLLYFINSPEKIQSIFYSLSWFGFLPLLSPISLIPALGDLGSYFIVANNLKESYGIYMHYRVTLAALLSWSTIIVISRFKFLNNKYFACYILFLAVIFQYQLHLPLSYLTKSWFWTNPQSLVNIEKVISYLPKNTSVVSQNNITPHLSHRDEIFTLFPEKKEFKNNSICGQKLCDWIKVRGKPEYLIVDASTEWDIRHFLTNREEYLNALSNMEKAGVINVYKKEGNAVLYKITYK